MLYSYIKGTKGSSYNINNYNDGIIINDKSETNHNIINGKRHFCSNQEKIYKIPIILNI